MGRRWTGTVIWVVGLAALLGLGGAAVAQEHYALEPADWGVDFVHAGNPEADAVYVEIMGSGACVFDHDGDGWEDLFLVNTRYWNETKQAEIDPRSTLYENQDGQGFEKKDGVLDLSLWGMGCAAGDYDGDGDPDLAINTWGGPVLYRNDGQGTWTNVTDEANLFTPRCGLERCFGASIAWMDIELDGDLDLFVTNYLNWDQEGIAAPNLYPAQCNVLFENQGDGTFLDVTDEAGVGDCGGNHLGLAIADFDGDGYQDIHIASDETRDAMLMNNGDGTFRDATDELGVGDTRGGMGTAAGDYDGDGRLDFVNTHFEREGFALYRQHEDGTYTDQAQAAGLFDASETHTGWGTELLDRDMDGDLDLVLVNGHVNVSYGGDHGYGQQDLLLDNRGDGTFEDVTTSAWHPSPRKSVGRGLATADVDQDGYLDLVVVNNPNETVDLYRSVRGPNNWLQLTLTGAGEVNPDALGATATVTVGDKTTTREIMAQNSYHSQSTRALRFGLGSALAVDQLTVTWPDGTEQTFADLGVNQRLRLETHGTLETVRQRVVAEAPVEVTANRLDPIELTGSPVRAEGTPLTRWTFQNETTDGDTREVQLDELGTYEAVYRVEQADGQWDEAITEVRVENLPPTAAIDLPDTVGRQEAVALSGEPSQDRDGTVVNWTWTVAGETLHGPEVELAFEEAGDHTIQLTVRDDQGLTDTATATLRVVSQPPIARAGPDVTANLESVIRFDGRDSQDPEGEIASWHWDLGDGTTADVALVNHTYQATGTYTATLTVTDREGGTDQDTLVVTVGQGQAPPVARPGPEQLNDRLTPVTLDARKSFDPDGEITTYAWDLGDGTQTNGAVVEHTYEGLGTYVVNLTVTDDAGETAWATTNVTIVNLAPELNLGPNVDQEGLAPVALNVTASDRDGTVGEITWELGDGSTATGATVTHTYATYGYYTVKVTATDQEGASTTERLQVWLYARPVLRVPDHVVGDRLDEVVLDASGTSDPDGTVTRLTWTLPDGQTVETDILELGFDELGTHTFGLTAQDDDGFTNATQVEVEIINLPPVPMVTGYTLANVDQVLTYDARESTDPDGFVDTRRWRTSDATSLAGRTVDHGFPSTGDHGVTLEVTDNEGARAETRHAVRVVDGLGVTAWMEASTYGPLGSPQGHVQVQFANGLPVETAQITARVTYMLDPVGHVTEEPRPLHRWTLEGESDQEGRWTFQVPPLAPGLPTWLPVPHTPTELGPAATWGHYRVEVNATWTSNHGAATTSYGVDATGELATETAGPANADLHPPLRPAPPAPVRGPVAERAGASAPGHTITGPSTQRSGK